MPLGQKEKDKDMVHSTEGRDDSALNRKQQTGNWALRAKRAGVAALALLVPAGAVSLGRQYVEQNSWHAEAATTSVEVHDPDGVVANSIKGKVVNNATSLDNDFQEPEGDGTVVWTPEGTAVTFEANRPASGRGVKSELTFLFGTDGKVTIDMKDAKGDAITRHSQTSVQADRNLAGTFKLKLKVNGADHGGFAETVGDFLAQGSVNVTEVTGKTATIKIDGDTVRVEQPLTGHGSKLNISPTPTQSEVLEVARQQFN